MNNERLIVIPIEGTVIFPKSTTKLAVDKKYGDYLYQLMNDETVSAIALSKRPNSDGDKSDDFYAIGVILELNSIKTTADGYLVKVVAKDKVQVNQMEFTKKYITAISDELYEEIDLDDIGHRAMLEFVTKLIHELGERFPGSDSFLKRIDELRTVDQILGEIAPYINISMNDKQQLMELNSVRKRGMQAIEILRKQKDAIDLQIEMAKRYSNKNNKTYREQLLREQMKAIQEELSDDDDDGKVDYRKNIEAAGMPADVKKVALSELRKLEGNSQNNAESNIIRNYLELLLDLPWKAPEVTEVNLDKARTILREQHYGLDEVKTRIIQHLAVMKLKKEKQGSILLLVGPPGTGKTSLGKSIAEALGREYIRISLGGVRDESEIRGHRKTYIGAMPGRIIGGMKNAGTTNPVFILDEIDKLSSSYNGDPASALLEVLDPEQNNSFADHYLNVPYDLSNVFFVATANNVSSIPGPLRDRMEIIEISSYTNKEKLEIGKRHLLPQVLEEHGLTRKELQLTPKAFEAVINQYTREAGVRGLKKQLSKIARVASEKVVSNSVEMPFKIKVSMLEDVLGKQRVRHEETNKENIPGVVTGLAWTPVGGEILFIEGTFMPGNGKLTLTGQLGSVMKESAQISMSLIRSRLANQLSGLNFTTSDIHIHVPSGSTPKDGPSAGVALFTSLASLALGKKVDAKLAMTGEITLRGAVTPVGGIKEKVIAAHRAGVKRIILPKDNQRDLAEIPEEVKADLEFIFVSSVEEVIAYVFNIKLQMPSFKFEQTSADLAQDIGGV